MAEDLKQPKVISKNNTGFPEYLDFDTLRREGIGYLGKLSGKIWTDHNVHDPGITILEMLCYALLDLGYRTNLPAADIFTADPADPSKENNFFSPAQILTNNPLTITDFRKLLIDIPGIRNAWLEISNDIDPGKFCDSNNNGFADDDCCNKYLNGLYHVYIDTEINIEKTFGTDIIAKNKYSNDLKKKVTDALLSHRNFCEDFLDISLLCKLEIGVCADIELETGADAGQVYLQIAEGLYKFFSPAPSFYTLPQLLDKGKTMDDIFAGRPINITESHGFVDTEAFEQLLLRKSIHLSDVYSVLLSIEGIRKVQHLQLKKCSDNQQSGNWTAPVPENHVLEFSISCSGFQFSRHGVPVLFDAAPLQTRAQINTQQNGKILYKEMFPALDYKKTPGIFRNHLDRYYSIQNEFPRVYGIAEGGLPDNVSPARKAWALQLKAYLLFFDQLLANYLSQLKSIQSLFAFKTPAGGQGGRTYFVNNDLASVPDLEKLLRLSKDTGDNGIVQQSTLARPVDKAVLLQLIDTAQIRNADIEMMGTWQFANADALSIAVAQLMDDISNNNFETGIVEKTDECVFYYLFNSSDCFALVSNRYFSSYAEAKQAIESLTYVAGFSENYNSWFDSHKNFAAFDIAFSLADYSKYLQLIAEDQTLFEKRRQSFLSHLLSRFAEQFTDYAMLSYGDYKAGSVANEIYAKENFLSHYTELSANRGRGYNYKLNGWNNDNVSGFEKRFKAYSGISNWKRHSLCNFEVVRYKSKFNYQLTFADQLLFETKEIFNSKEDADTAIKALLQQLKNPLAYQLEANSDTGAHSILLHYQQQQPAVLTIKFANAEDAEKIKNNLPVFFGGEPGDGNIFINSYLYNARLVDSRGEVIKTFHDAQDDAASAKATAAKNIAKINTGNIWKDSGDKKLINGKLVFGSSVETDIFIDAGNFKVIINNAIVGSPDKYTYELLDRNNSFKLSSANEFPNEKAAKQDSEHLLTLLVAEENYSIEKDQQSDRYKLMVKEGTRLAAVADANIESEQAAKTLKALIQSIVNESTYRLTIHESPDTWKFSYSLGYDPASPFIFESDSVFKSSAEAGKAATEFSDALAAMQLKETDGAIAIAPAKSQRNNVSLTLKKVNPKQKKVKKDELQQMEMLLAVQKDARRLAQKDEPKIFEKFIHVDALSQSGLFAYRLVDKDNSYAFYQTDVVLKADIEAHLPGVISLGAAGYNYLDICLKGEVANKRKDEKNNYWYHYQVRSANGINKPGSSELKTLVLFESARGYESFEEAMTAFEKMYLDILKLGSAADNYGVSKLISKVEVLVQSNDPCVKSESIVFVPKETLEYFGDEATAIEELVKVVKSYPVKKILPEAECKEFHTRFKACEEGACNSTEKCDCAQPTKEKTVYYFSLYNRENDREDWQSVRYYESAAEAWKELQFFILLLRYSGNYMIDCTCRSIWNEKQQLFESSPVYRIFIREVLAESAGRFMTEEEAWGPKGVQQFIDVAQAENTFHNFLEKNCCNSFYVACNNTRLYHPCKYNTPGQRDKALRLLYKSLANISNWKWEGCNQQLPGEGILLPGEIILKDFDGNSVAKASFNDPAELSGYIDYFELYAGILDQIALNGLFIEKEQVYLCDKSILFTPVDPANNITPNQLREKLTWLADWFPFSIKRSANGVKYCIDIKLPGLDADITDDCCSGEAGGAVCYSAWKGDCCYNNCTELLNAWQTALLLLSDINNYRQVHDCDCHSYGIALHYINTFGASDKNNECGYFINQQQRIILPCENAIVAFSPQCYPDAKFAGDAVCRAKALINAEGLHVAEHILMRPHCVGECECRLPVLPNEFSNCKFPFWEKITDDPCEKAEKPACFVPGNDPYSFIATIVLPAWPLKFRSDEKKLLIENILHREAPAHVMLRILWLAPHDFCCFEKIYKEWQAWLAQKRRCTNFTFCDLRDFLFNRQYERLREPAGCLTCDEQTLVADPCRSKRVTKTGRESSVQWEDKINEVFSWTRQNSADYNFISCEEQRQRDEVIDTTVIEARPSVLKRNIEQTLEKAGAEKMSKAKFIRARFSQYVKQIDELMKETKNAAVVEMTRRFVDNNAPTMAEYKKLVESIIKAQDDKKNKLLIKKRATTLLSIITRFFIDKWAFNGKEISSLENSAGVFELLRQNKTGMIEIYRLWESDALKKHEPGIDMNAVKRLLTGNK